MLRYEPFIAHRGGKNRWLSFGDAIGGIFDCILALSELFHCGHCLVQCCEEGIDRDSSDFTTLPPLPFNVIVRRNTARYPWTGWDEGLIHYWSVCPKPWTAFDEAETYVMNVSIASYLTSTSFDISFVNTIEEKAVDCPSNDQHWRTHCTKFGVASRACPRNLIPRLLATKWPQSPAKAPYEPHSFIYVTPAHTVLVLLAHISLQQTVQLQSWLELSKPSQSGSWSHLYAISLQHWQLYRMSFRYLA